MRSRDRQRPRRVLGTFNSGTSDDHRARTGTAVWIRSFKYAGVEEDMVAGLRMTTEHELEQLSGSGRSSTLALRRTW